MIRKAFVDGYGLALSDIREMIDVKEFKKFFNIDTKGKTFSELEKNGFRMEYLSTYKSPLDEEILINLFTVKQEVYIFMDTVCPWDEGLFKDEEEVKNYIYHKIKKFLKKNVQKSVFKKIGVLIEY